MPHRIQPPVARAFACLGIRCDSNGTLSLTTGGLNMAPTAQAQPLSALPTAIERRFYPRIVPLAPICISINDANPCLVINVGENGLLLSTRTGLPRNSVARIALPLDGL